MNNLGLTVGELIKELHGCNWNDEIFMGGLQYNRLKRRNDNLIQMEFIQTVYTETKTGKVKVQDCGE